VKKKKKRTLLNSYLNSKSVKTLFLFVILFGFVPSSHGIATNVELGLSGMFFTKDFGNQTKLWQRNYSFAVGYFLLSGSEIETHWSDILSRNTFLGSSESSYHDQISSLNWVQSLTGRNWTFQPFVKIGFGLVLRDVSGSIDGVVLPPARLSTHVALAGLGFRSYLSSVLALKVEAISYLVGGVLATWQNNLYFQAGLFLYL